ncbi:hypothetical protein R84B8_00296 [Treponema sp. R8-4-B8]
MENVNKKFKNSVFSFIFSNPDVLRELYCALEGITLSPNVPVVINTLELFESTESLGLSEKEYLTLELEVKIININKGKNEKIARKCKTLAQYSAFIAKVREYQKVGASLKDAVKKTVQYCKKHDILKELMEKHAKEVMSMLTTEWNWDTAKRVWQDEAREEGKEEGREEFARNALVEGVSDETIQKITGLSLDEIKRLKN